MTKEDKNKLTGILFAQTVAGARNVKPIDRLEALYNDIGSLVADEEPTQSRELT